ncbi:hypothetical protein ACNKHU_01170 [Shigella flexneri]
MAKQVVYLLKVQKERNDAELAMKIFDLVEKWAAYGFNKSHSAAYAFGVVSNVMAESTLSCGVYGGGDDRRYGQPEKVVGLVDECWRSGAENPATRGSGLYHFHVKDDGEIVYGIGAIKGVGEGPIEAIIEADNRGGYFRELFDLCARTDTKKLNRRVLEKLIISGL